MSDPKITIRVEGSGLPAGGADGQVLSQQNGKPVWVKPPKSEDSLPLAGGTLKGDLNIGSTSEPSGAQLRIAKQGADGKGYQMGNYISGGNMARTDYIADGSISNFMQLGPTETGFGKPVRVSSGGTGVTSYEELKAKLDVIPTPSTAQVGQTIVVKSVDENGKPTEWEAVDMAGGSGGLTIINLTYNPSADTYVSDLARNEIEALVAEGKQCVYYDGTYYSSLIDIFGSAIIYRNSIGNSVGTSVYYYEVTVGAWDTSVKLKPIVNTPYILMDNLVYKLAVGTDGAVIATRVTDGSIIGE